MMRIEKTNYGKRVWVNNEYGYDIPNLKVLNGCVDQRHPYIQELLKKEAQLERRLLILLFSMEKCLADSYNASSRCEWFYRWEERNHIEFHHWFDDQIYKLIEKLRAITNEYSTIKL